MNITEFASAPNFIAFNNKETRHVLCTRDSLYQRSAAAY